MHYASRTAKIILTVVHFANNHFLSVLGYAILTENITLTVYILDDVRNFSNILFILKGEKNTGRYGQVYMRVEKRDFKEKLIGL